MQIISLVHAGAGDAFIRIDVSKPILGMTLGIVLVVSDLCGEGVKLVFAVTGYSAVGCQPDRFLCRFFLGCNPNNVHCALVYGFIARFYLAVYEQVPFQIYALMRAG